MNNIIIGITGGIAAYKTLSLIRELKKLNYNIKVITTENALKFVTKTSIETLTNNPIYTTLWQYKTDTSHIALADWGDLIIVVPATANIIGKFANGIADDMLSTALLSFDKKIIMAPTMNYRMYNNAAVQENIKKLKKRDITIIEPEIGYLACGEMGKGRLPDIEKIILYIERVLEKSNKMINKRILISAGSTFEKIDPVRIITNLSSGKTGNAFAKAAWLLKAKKIMLVHGNMSDKPFIMAQHIYVPIAKDMYEALRKEIKNYDILIMAAAISDFKCEYSNKKIKTEKEIKITLKENINILSKLKKCKIIKVGFALETNNAINNGKQKMKKYNLDYIIINTPDNINSDKGEYIIINKNGKQKHVIKKDKNKAAMEILKWIV